MSRDLTKSRLRWLLVGDGESVHVHRLVTALSVAGDDIHVASFAAGPGLDAKAHLLPGGSLGKSRYLRAVPALRRLIRQLNPDIVNAHYVSSYGLMAAMATARRLVQTAWGTDILVTARRPIRRQLAAFAVRRAHLATGDSTSVLEGLRELSERTPRHRFVFGPPLAAFDPAVRKEPLVVSPRRHESFYRIETILNSWSIASQRLPGYRLVVVGSGSCSARLRSRSYSNVEFVGDIPHDVLMDLFARARLVISIPDTDATSAALLEALATRCSVVASDLPANREWVPRSHLVPVNPSSAVLTDAIVRVVNRSLSLDSRWSLERQVDGFRTIAGDLPPGLSHSSGSNAG